MTARTRRDVIVIAAGLAAGPVLARLDFAQSDTARTLEAFRTAVSMLRETTEPALLDMRVADVEKLGNNLVAQGISWIDPELPCDGACNHWLSHFGAQGSMDRAKRNPPGRQTQLIVM